MKNIPQSRILFYLILIGFLPLIFISVSFLVEQGEFDEFEASLNGIKEKAMSLEKKQALNMAVRAHYKDADHFYIDKHLETLSFLEPEIESLQKIVANKNYVENEAIKKRLEFLTTANGMIFSEGVVQTLPLFQETVETLVHPVEINLANLQEILSLTEGIPIGPYKPAPDRPQLIILDFKIDKKGTSEKNEVFVLNLKLLKREFL